MVCMLWDLWLGSGLGHLAESVLEDEKFNSLKQIFTESFTICKTETKEIRYYITGYTSQTCKLTFKLLVLFYYIIFFSIYTIISRTF